VAYPSINDGTPFHSPSVKPISPGVNIIFYTQAGSYVNQFKAVEEVWIYVVIQFIRNHFRLGGFCAISNHNGRNPLQQLRRIENILGEHQITMRVHIDKPGRNNQAMSVYHSSSLIRVFFEA